MKLVWEEGYALKISLESSFIKTRSHFVSHGSLKFLSSNNPPALVSHVNVNRYGFCSLDISILQHRTKMYKPSHGENYITEWNLHC